jgi:hypothetical protein
MRKVPTISQPEPKLSDELGGVERNESVAGSSQENLDRTQGHSQRPEEIRPDIEYQGLKIDLSTIEWIIVGITAVFCFYLYHTNSS